MYETVVVACGHPQLRQILTMAAGEISKRTPIALVSADQVSALRANLRTDPKHELLIIEGGLAPSPSTTAARGELPGLDLVLRVQGEADPPACILILEETSTDIARKIQRLPRCEPLYAGDQTDYIDYCGQLAKRLEPRERLEPSERLEPRARLEAREPVANIQRAPYALLDINLGQEPKTRFIQLAIPDPVTPIRKSAPLDVDDKSLAKLVERSRRLSMTLSHSLTNRPGIWRLRYRQLGEDIYKMLATDAFTELYELAAEHVSASNIRFRFTLHHEIYDTLWEAMLNHKRDRPFMIDNMITRRADYEDDDLDSRLNTADGCLRVLAISSDVPGGAVPDGPDDPLYAEFWNRLAMTLPPLTHVDDEVRAIAALGRKHGRARQGTGQSPQLNVEVISGSKALSRGGRWSLADEVEEKLQAATNGNVERPRYNIVHFAGHALFPQAGRRDDQRGYLVFSGRPHPRAVPIAVFADWLEQAGVQLVYLSCCRSSAAPAAFELALNRVPMAIGFSWEVDDKKAVSFAQRFYDHLFDSHQTSHMRVCKAFLKTRKRLYDVHRAGDPIWASPVLVAQPLEWSRVETFFSDAATRTIRAAHTGEDRSSL